MQMFLAAFSAAQVTAHRDWTNAQTSPGRLDTGRELTAIPEAQSVTMGGLLKWGL